MSPEKESETVLFNRLLKFIILIGIFSLGLLLCPQISGAVDKLYPYFNYSELYGDLNLEFRSQGIGGEGLTSQMEHAFIHYYRLGFHSYIWDPRLIQYNVLGNFYQELRFGDIIDENKDYYRFGGSGSLTFFPQNPLRATLFLAREQIFNPNQTVTHYEINALLFKRFWPVLDLKLTKDTIVSDDKNFPEDLDYMRAQLNFNHVLYFKSKKSSNGNGNNNANGDGNGNGNGNVNGNAYLKKLPPDVLTIAGYLEYFTVDDRLNKGNTTDKQMRAQLMLNYVFNNNQSYIFNTYDWFRTNDTDNFQVSLRYFNMLPTKLSYSLGGYFNYNTGGANNNFSIGFAGSLNKIFSPQWMANAGLAGQFSGGSTNSFAISGYGGVFSRIFKDFDWGANMTAGLNTGEGDSTFNYALNLTGMYRLSPNKLLYGDYTLALISGDQQNFDSRLRLTFEGYWYPRLTLRSIAEFRLQNRSDSGQGGNGGTDMILSLDNYMLYRISSYTNLNVGLYFAHTSTANSDSEQRLRAYAVLSSSPWRNLSYSLTADAYYELQKAQWNIRIYPQIFYRWRQLYFSLTGTLNYFTAQDNKSGWNYDLIFKVTRPFNIRF